MRAIDTPSVIRPATPADLEALGRLGAILVANHHELDPRRFLAPTAETPAGYARFLATRLGRSDAVVLIADGEAGIVGYAYATLEGTDYNALRGPAGVLHDLVVDPAHRGRGIGAALLEAITAAVDRLGAPRLVLSTAEANRAAQRLFTRAGFRRTMIEMTRDLGGGENPPETTSVSDRSSPADR